MAAASPFIAHASSPGFPAIGSSSGKNVNKINHAKSQKKKKRERERESRKREKEGSHILSKTKSLPRRSSNKSHDPHPIFPSTTRASSGRERKNLAAAPQSSPFALSLALPIAVSVLHPRRRSPSPTQPCCTPSTTVKRRGVPEALQEIGPGRRHSWP